MALKYGDAVVLVQRLPDGTLRRVNAIVMHSAVQPPNVHRSKALKDHRGIIPEGEYLDIAFPRVLADGQALKSRTMEALFQPDWAVPAWKEGANKGWELPATFEAENAKLRAELALPVQSQTCPYHGFCEKCATYGASPQVPLPGGEVSSVVHETKHLSPDQQAAEEESHS